MALILPFPMLATFCRENSLSSDMEREVVASVHSMRNALALLVSTLMESPIDKFSAANRRV